MGFAVGESVGAFQIVDYIGQGGMATIYKAYQTTLDRYVAIKVIHPALKEDQSFVLRLKREASIIAKLDHPNIVTVYDFSDFEGIPFLVMRFIEGKTLKAILQEQKLGTHQIINIIHPVADALTFAHARGVLHRDVKPSNIMIDNDGHVFLTDFGLARIAHNAESTSSSDMMIGSPHYISPEQAKSEPVDARTDIYSLGIVLYEMFTGRVPFSGETAYATILSQINDPPPPPRSINPKIRPAVETVLLKALSKNPHDRYGSVRALMQALENAARGPREEDEPVAPISLAEYTHSPQNAIRESLTRIGDQVRAVANVFSGNSQTPRAKSFLGAVLGFLFVLFLCLGIAIIAMVQLTPSNNPLRGTPNAATSIAAGIDTRATLTAAPTVTLAPLRSPVVPTPTITPLPPTPTPTRQSTTVVTATPQPQPIAPDAPRGKIAYSIATGDAAELHAIWLANADGSGAHQIIELGMWPAISPDSKQILYNRTKEKGIYIANIDGSNPRQILGSQACCGQWSPDGKHIVYYMGDTQNFRFERAIYTANIDGTNATKIAEGYNPTWSPDGNRIAYAGCQASQNQCGIFTYDLRTKANALITRDNGAVPQWSPRGDRIVYQADDGKGHLNVFVVNPDGTGMRQLTFGKGNDGQPVWSDDGNFIFWRSDQDGKEWSIYVMRADGSNPRLLIPKAPPDANLWARESLGVGP